MKDGCSGPSCVIWETSDPISKYLTTVSSTIRPSAVAASIHHVMGCYKVVMSACPAIAIRCRKVHTQVILASASDGETDPESAKPRIPDEILVPPIDPRHCTELGLVE